MSTKQRLPNLRLKHLRSLNRCQTIKTATPQQDFKMANISSSLENKNSKHLFLEAQHHIPGGVNSPVRAFGAVGGTPLFFERASGAFMFDADGNLKNVADLIEELDSVLAPMSDELKASTLDQLGLNRGVADAVKILSGAGDEIRAYEQALHDSGGTTADVADKQMGSLKAQIELMTNAFSELGILLGEVIAPALTSIVGFITKVVQATS